MPNIYHFSGRNYPVLGRMTINRRLYLLLDRLSGGDREKYQAVCPGAGPGSFRMVHLLPHTPSTVQLLRVLQRMELGKYNFPEILEWQPCGKQMVLVTTWIWGEPLAARLQRARERPSLWPHPWVAFRLFRGLAHSLHYLNQCLNIIHGDVHPGNLILVRNSNRLIVTDFGSAWTVEDSIRRLGGDGRTDGYASPEQHLDLKRVDFRSDMFSASAIAYVMLTGELPFMQLGGKVALPALRASCEGAWVPPSAKCARARELSNDLWRRIDSLLERGLALDANRRFSSTPAWLNELNDIDARFRIRPEMGFVSRLILNLMRFWQSRPA